MPTLNELTDPALKTSDRIFAWLLILFGYTVALAIALDTAGWDDPVFNVVRKLPYTPYSWAVILGVGVSIYTFGEMAQHNRWRGRFVIGGALFCAVWCAAMAAAMSRMVYVMPTRVTDLWPLVMSFVATLYFSRVIIYADAFTGVRWTTNPYQLWATMFLVVISLSQMIIGVAPSSVFTEVERPVAFQMAAANFIGATIVMFGLHLRNKETGLNLELAGSVSLVATLAWYCAAVLHRQPLAGTTLGFGIAESFVFATLHRSVQILTLKWARLRGHPQLEQRVTQALHAEMPVTESTPRHGL